MGCVYVYVFTVNENIHPLQCFDPQALFSSDGSFALHAACCFFAPLTADFLFWPNRLNG